MVALVSRGLQDAQRVLSILEGCGMKPQLFLACSPELQKDVTESWGISGWAAVIVECIKEVGS